eukprot:1809829-Pyramimonas_sp.AAC.1
MRECNNILSIGVSCRSDDTSKERGRQFLHGCPCLPGDNRIQTGLRIDPEVLVMAGTKNLSRDNTPIWRSANDIVMTAGWNGRIPPTHIVQLIGILPCYTCQCNRVGQRDSNQPYPSGKIEDMYEIRNDASSLKEWFISKTPYNLKCPDPSLVQEVVFSTVLMMGTGHAGTPAGGPDGTWIQAQSADVTGITPSGITRSDTLCANDPWRAHVQPLPVPAGQPASFAPMNRATTPFGIPQGAWSNNGLQARLQSIRMDPQLYQA